MDYDLIVIGAGPGGYVGAIRAAQLGLKVALIEKESKLGGTCLNLGCIPSKALLESSERFDGTKKDLKRHGVKVEGVTLDLNAMMKRKDSVVSALTKGIDGLVKKNKIERLVGTGSFKDDHTVVVTGDETREITGKNIMIATGSVPSPLDGVELDFDRIGTSTEALSWPDVPEHLVVIGGGVIGLELGSVWLRLGAKVTVLEYQDHILPGMDADLCKEALKLFKKQGFKFNLGARVTGATTDGKSCTVTVADSDDITCDRVLLAVGRRPNTEGLGLENVGITTDKRGCVEVDDHFRTAKSHIMAIGDVIRGPMLAHKAEEEGIAAVEHLVEGYGHVNYNAIPGIVYTHPEVASVGKTQAECEADGTPIKTGRFNFMGNGRARALGDTSGFVKIIADAETDRVLGVHIIGPRAGDLIAEAAVAMEYGASSEDVARACHAHPTLAEAVKEAALDVLGRAIHA